MKSMKMDEAEQKAYAAPSVMSGQPLYPWGLQITLDDEALKKLGLKELPKLDQVMAITCKAQVTSVSSRKDGDDESCDCLQLQITDMEVVDSGKDSAAKKLYGGE